MDFIDWDGAQAHMTAKLIEMTREGASRADVARALNISRNAVVGRVSRLKRRGVLLPDGSVPLVAAGGPKVDWSELDDEARIQLLEDWRERGVTIREALAEVVGTSRSALHGWAHKRGYAFNWAQRFAGNAVTYNRADIRRRRTRTKKVEDQLRKAAERAAAEPPTNEPVHFSDLADCHCRFMTGHMMYCGAPTKGVRVEPYCAFHASITYASTDQRSVEL